MRIVSYSPLESQYKHIMKHFLLKIYAITLTAILCYILISGFKDPAKSKEFKEITVERINIVEPDGKLVMTLSNSTRQHPGLPYWNRHKTETPQEYSAISVFFPFPFLVLEMKRHFHLL